MDILSRWCAYNKLALIGANIFHKLFPETLPNSFLHSGGQLLSVIKLQYNLDYILHAIYSIHNKIKIQFQLKVIKFIELSTYSRLSFFYGMQLSYIVPIWNRYRPASMHAFRIINTFR